MTRTRLRTTIAIAALSVTLLAPGLAAAQSNDGNFLDNLFNRGQGQPQAPQGGAVAPADDEMSVRLGRMENALRQLTGTIEQLQYQNQQLQMQLKRLQDDTEYRFQQMGVRGGATAPAAAPNMPAAPQAPGRRGDVFDPNQQPNAPGAPRALGQTASNAPVTNEPPVGAPGGREPGAPLDLSSLAGNGTPQPVPPPANQPATGGQAAPQLATLPPSAKPQDEYDLAYGYVLHKDYGLAEQAFNAFQRKHPNEKLVPEANYWLGESQFQQQRYSDAAKAFLVVITKHERSAKAPEALLRLGQSLAALNKKEAACATLAEVGRKYPKAPANLKRSVAAEQKRVHC